MADDQLCSRCMTQSVTVRSAACCPYWHAPSAAGESMSKSPPAAMVMFIAALLLLVTFGVRQSTGLFLLPLVSTTCLVIAAVSLAMAVAQFTWGLSQPLLGALSDRHGPTRVLVIGGLMLALGCALTPLADSQSTLILTLGILTPFG